jgi:hypothetical protein
MSELKPCRSCGASCKIEPIKNEHFQGNIWICSRHARIGGGSCESDIYLTREAWQARPEDQVIEVNENALTEVIDHITCIHGHLVAAVIAMQTALGLPDDDMTAKLRHIQNATRETPA